jgi:hypothetical protein
MNSAPPVSAGVVIINAGAGVLIVSSAKPPRRRVFARTPGRALAAAPASNRAVVLAGPRGARSEVLRFPLTVTCAHPGAPLPRRGRRDDHDGHRSRRPNKPDEHARRRLLRPDPRKVRGDGTTSEYSIRPPMSSDGLIPRLRPSSVRLDLCEIARKGYREARPSWTDVRQYARSVSDSGPCPGSMA